MLMRMAIYHALLREKYKYELPIKQFMLYVGKEKMTVKAQDTDLGNH